MNRKTLVIAVLLSGLSFSYAERKQHGYGGYSGYEGYGGYGTGSNSKSTQVDGYSRRDGTYVQPHQRTVPNNTESDNYNTYGNYNPYSGKSGRNRRDYDSDPYDNR